MIAASIILCGPFVIAPLYQRARTEQEPIRNFGDMPMQKRSKEPMSRLNDVLSDELAKLPRFFLAKLLKRKVAEAGHSISDETAEAFAAHLFNDPDAKFVWDDVEAGEIDVSLEFSDSDFAELEAEVEEFSENKLPDVILNVKDSAAEAILKSLKEDWPNQKAYDDEIGSGFLIRLEGDWGEAFDLLRMMLVISREVGQEYIDWINIVEKRRTSPRYAALLKLHARGCQVAMEVVCLMENGFADGAFGRWRTLHEIAVVATLLVDGDDDLAKRYLAHECIEAKRAMDHFKVNYEVLGYDAPSDDEVARIQHGYDSCLNQYGHNFGSQYGWAGAYLKLKKPTFFDLEKEAGHIGARSHYLFASYNVHASPKGINYRLGLVDQEEALLTGMSNVGFFEPGNSTAHSLVQLNLTLLRDRWDFDTLVIAQILLNIRSDVPDALHRVQEEIEGRILAKPPS